MSLPDIQRGKNDTIKDPIDPQSLKDSKALLCSFIKEAQDVRVNHNAQVLV